MILCHEVHVVKRPAWGKGLERHYRACGFRGEVNA